MFFNLVAQVVALRVMCVFVHGDMHVLVGAQADGSVLCISHVPASWSGVWMGGRGWTVCGGAEERHTPHHRLGGTVWAGGVILGALGSDRSSRDRVGRR